MTLCLSNPVAANAVVIPQSFSCILKTHETKDFYSILKKTCGVDVAENELVPLYSAISWRVKMAMEVSMNSVN